MSASLKIAELLEHLTPTPRELQTGALETQNSDLENQVSRLTAAMAEEQELRNTQRYKFARYFLQLAVAWLVFVAAMVALNGLSSVPYFSLPFALSDNVVMFLLGSSTFKILGPAFLVARYLFTSPRKT